MSRNGRGAASGVRDALSGWLCGGSSVDYSLHSVECGADSVGVDRVASSVSRAIRHQLAEADLILVGLNWIQRIVIVGWPHILGKLERCKVEEGISELKNARVRLLRKVLLRVADRFQFSRVGDALQRFSNL